MLFVPPDQETPTQDIPEAEGEELRLDSLESKEDEAAEKVELDLDDLPFLEEEEEEEVEETQEPEPPSTVDEGAQSEKEEKQPEATPSWKKKWFIILLILLIIALAGAIYFFVFRSPTAPSEPAQPEVVEKKKPSHPQPSPPPPPEEITIPFKPFWVELTFKGKTKFLYCKFLFSTTNDKLIWEIKRKKIVLRDAIYYYLRNKDIMFLNNEKNGEQLKKDILTVVNLYLNNGQLEKMLIEEYVVK